MANRAFSPKASATRCKYAEHNFFISSYFVEAPKIFPADLTEWYGLNPSTRKVTRFMAKADFLPGGLRAQIKNPLDRNPTVATEPMKAPLG